MLPVQFITHHTDRIDYETSAMLALEAGCRWIQLRMKGATDEEVRPVAQRLLTACHEQGAILIIDDRIELCKELGADGVHLGREDMPVNEARELLGNDTLIGGTANTYDDIRRLRRESADYIGLGPFRYTTTKTRLSPVLGIEGYKLILEQMRRDNLRLPVVAIGGVTLEDVPALMATGVGGIAVSGTVLNAPDPVAAMKALLEADKEGL